jgi:hypothetical protein
MDIGGGLTTNEDLNRVNIISFFVHISFIAFTALVIVVSCTPAIKTSSTDDVIFRIPDAVAMGESELGLLPGSTVAQWTNSSLFLRVIKSIIMIDINRNSWDSVHTFGADTVVIDFQVLPDKKHILYSLITDGLKYFNSFGKRYHSILCVKDFESDSIKIIYEQEDHLFFNITFFNDNKVAFMQRYYIEFPMGRTMSGEIREYLYSDIIKLLNLNDLSSISISVSMEDYQPQAKLTAINDTLVIWTNRDDSITKPAILDHCPMKIKFFDPGFLLKSCISMWYAKSLDYHGSNMFYCKMWSDDSITFLNFETSRAYKYYIGGNCYCVISSNDSLVAVIKNIYKSSFWSGDHRVLEVRMVDIHDKIRKANKWCQSSK